MNQYDHKKILELRKVTKNGGMNRYRFAWWLMNKHPNLVVEIIRSYLSEAEKREKLHEMPKL